MYPSAKILRHYKHELWTYELVEKTRTRNVTFRKKSSALLWIARSYVICGTKGIVEVSTMSIIWSRFPETEQLIVDRVAGCFLNFYIECMVVKTLNQIDQKNVYFEESRTPFACSELLYKLTRGVAWGRLVQKMFIFYMRNSELKELYCSIIVSQ